MNITSTIFGRLPNGQEIKEYTLTNKQGVSVKLITYGATLVSLKTPDKQGNFDEITLGFDNLADYLAHKFYFGTTIGRVANRISHSRFNYGDTQYTVTPNYEQFHHLHGGLQGFDKVIWEAAVINGPNEAGIKFSYKSLDGAEGYPGNLTVTTTYLLTEQNELKINFWAQTDKPTPVDLTNHTYWNLAGAGKDNVLRHELQVFADAYVVTEKFHIPTGEIHPVENTPFDFKVATPLGARIQQAGGYDLCFVLNTPVNHLRRAAYISDPNSGRSLEVLTTQPGLQFYTGNYLTDYPIAGQRRTSQYGGFCFETQNFPDAVNHPNFPTPFLLPEQTYQHETVFKF